MTVGRMVNIVAGLLIVISVILSSIYNGVKLTEPTWLWVSLFVGINLFQSGLTQWCLMATFLKKLGLKP